MSEPRLHVVVVNDFAHVNGGTAQVALSSAIELARRGHAVTLFAAVPPVMEELTANGVTVICTGQPEIAADPHRLAAAFRGIRNGPAIHRMTQLLSSLDPAATVIHCHGWFKSLSAGVVARALQRSFPVLVTLHDYFVACPNGGFYNFQTDRICTLTPLSLPCLCTHCDKTSYAQKIWRVARQEMQKYWERVPGHVGHFITVSGVSRKILTPHLPTGAVLYDVANPVTVDKAAPARPETNRAVVFVGRLSPEKGGSRLARAASLTDIPVIFVGDGECRREIETCNPKAVITGWVTPAEVRRHLASARALVAPSLCYETFGLTVLEAAACGIPALVPDTSAAREAVADGESGLWFRGGDVNDLAAKLALLVDDNLVRKMGQATYERFWSDPPTLGRHVDHLEKVYRQILSPCAAV